MKYRRPLVLILVSVLVVFAALTVLSCQPKSEYKIMTVAGKGSPEFSGDGGPARLAGLNGPNWIHICKDSSILISDRENRRIRRITPKGTISTIAGGDVRSDLAEMGDNGPAIDAQIYRPIGISADSLGNIYFADASANTQD